MKTRIGFSLVEGVVAAGIAALFCGMVVHQALLARTSRQSDLKLDQLQNFHRAVLAVEHDVHNCRTIVYPLVGQPPSRALVLRGLDGRLLTYYFSPARGELRRAILDLVGTSSERAFQPVRDLKGVYFSVSPQHLVSWSLVSPRISLVGAYHAEGT